MERDSRASLCIVLYCLQLAEDVREFAHSGEEKHSRASSSMNESWYTEVFVGRFRSSFEGFDYEERSACLART